jgi:hypothetical protein
MNFSTASHGHVLWPANSAGLLSSDLAAITPWASVVEAISCAEERVMTSPLAITGTVQCEVRRERAEREAGVEERWERVRAWMVRNEAPAC